MFRLTALLSVLLALGWSPLVRAAPAPPAGAPDAAVLGAGAPEAVKLEAPAVIPEPEIPKSEPPELAAEELNLGWALFRTFIALAMVVGLAWLVLNVGLRRLMGIRPTAGVPVVKVLERVTLDQKRALFVVEAGGEVLLLGGAENSLSLITKLDRAHLEQAKAAAATAAAMGPVQLSPFLQKLLGRQDPPPPPPPPAVDR